MTAKSVLAAALVATLAGAWWWVLSGSSFQPAPTTAPLARPPAAVGADAPRVALDRLAARVTPPASAVRDPFRQRGSQAVAGAAAAAADVAAAPAELPPARPHWPTLSLIGVSQRTTTDGVRRVAVLAGERGVIHAAAGDQVAEVYRVEQVRDDAIDLLLVPESRVVTLRLGR